MSAGDIIRTILETRINMLGFNYPRECRRARRVLHDPNSTEIDWNEALGRLNRLPGCVDESETTPGEKNRGAPKKSERGHKTDLVIGAFVVHHKYDPDGSIGNWQPAKLQQLRDLADRKVGKATFTRFLQQQFEPSEGVRAYDLYVACCEQGPDAKKTLWHWIAQWRGDAPAPYHDSYSNLE
mgnify:CR=1 FL=1